MKLNPQTIAIRCAGDNKRTTLEQAVLDGWKICERCKLFICPDCITEFQKNMNDQCPSFVFGFAPHPMNMQQIPVEHIILFAEARSSHMITGGLIQQIFYDKEMMFHQPFSSSLGSLNNNNKSISEKKTSEMEDLEIIREETWRKFGTVLVKRKRGKFAAWEKIG